MTMTSHACKQANYVQRHLLLLLVGLLACLFISAPTAAQDSAETTQPGQVTAQGERFSIGYSQTRSGFLGPQTTHTWSFDGLARELITIRAQRIAGQFAPVLRLIAPDDSVLAVARAEVYPDNSSIVWDAGLPSDGTYRIEVSGTGLGVAQTENPDEYSLTLTLNGRRRFAPNSGLTPLPDVGLIAIPALESAPLDNGNALGVLTYGGISTQQQDNGLWEMQAGSLRLTLDNSLPIQRGIRSVSAVANGLGVLTTGNVPIFTRQRITVAYNSNSGLYTLTTSGGRSLITDMTRIASVQVADEAFSVTITPPAGTDPVRIVTTADDSRLLRLNAEKHVLRLPGGQYVESDLLGWDTLAYIDDELRVYYGGDGRLLADDVRFDDLNLVQTDPLTANIRHAADTDLRIDWRGMGDVRLQNGLWRVQPLDSRELVEPAATLDTLRIVNAAVQFQRNDGSFGLSLPDGTSIETPAQSQQSAAALPYQVGYIPRGFNNLGQDWLSVCPCVGAELEQAPVNPANGNFYYHVTDFDIPSHTLPLNWTRHYNSQDSGLTPDYMLASPAGYLLGQLGTGWRHSYQYELDITDAPLGQVTLILPDGTRHRFSALAANPTRYESNTLRPWVVEQVGGTLGHWQATTTSGVRYLFDRAGRLERISESVRRSVTFSPAPIASPDYGFAGRTGGVFITEPYGRRFEVFTGETGRIETVRDTSLRQISYSYDETNRLLTRAQYNTPTQSADYAYNADALLTGFDDVRSPYHHTGSLSYDGSRRVTRYIENPDTADGQATFQRIFAYFYDANPRQTRQLTNVNGANRQSIWRYTADPTYGLLLTDYQTPREGYSYSYSYTDGLLSNIRQPTLTNFSYQYDARGNLINYKDPLNPSDAAYDLLYEQRGYSSLLTDITYPSLELDRFSYAAPVADPGYSLQGYERPLLASHTERVLIGLNERNSTTRYEYDAWGRVVLVAEPGTLAPGNTGSPQIGTVYRYNAFGYISEIWQGLPLDPDTRLSDISSQDALRVLRLDYDIIGQLRAITDERGNTITLNWDSNTEQLRAIVGPLAAEILYFYDDLGQLTRIEDRGQITEYGYDALGHIASVTDGNGQITTYTHDEAGNLLRVVDALLRTFSYEYDALDNLTLARSPAGLATRYTTALEGGNSGRTITQQLDPNGRTTTRRYDALGRMRQLVTEQNDIQQIYNIEYNRRDLPTIIQKENGRTLALEYDFSGRIISTTVANATTRYDYDDAGNLLAVTAPSGLVTRYAYDTLGNLTALLLPDGTRTTYTYDENDNLLTRTDANGLTTTYVYDALNRVTAIEAPATGDTDRRTTYTYNQRGMVQTETDPRRTIRTYRYDALDQLLALTDGIGQETLYGYDALGRIAQIDFQAEGRDITLTYDTEGNISAVNEYRDRVRTLYTYDTSGRVTSRTNSLGHTTSYRYNAIDQISRIIDAVGNEQRYLWNESTLGLRRYRDANGRLYSYENTDALGRVLSILDITPADTTLRTQPPLNTRFSYDADGYITQLVIASDGAAPTQRTLHAWAYDAAGRPTQYTDPAGGRWRLGYDDAGRLSSMTNPLDNSTRYTYNAAGEVTRVTYQVGTTAEASEQFAYDANGNMTRYVSQAGVVSEYTYDGEDRVIAITEAVGTPDERRHTFQYNALDQLTSYQDPQGRVTRYLYTRGNLAQVRRTLDDNPIAEFYEYDLADNLTAILLPNNGTEPLAINLTYDALNRRVRYVDSEANVWAYTYDPVGNTIQISDPLGSSVRYTYDTYDRLARLTFPDNREVALGYDTTGNFRSVTLGPTDDTLQAPNPLQQTLNFSLDAAGNLTEISNLAADAYRYQHDVMGNVTRRTAPDGDQTRYTYDAANRLIETNYINQGQAITYIYDTAGQPARILGPASGQRLDFTYDAHGQLIRERSSSADIRYTRDAAGNIIERNAGELGTTSYTVDALDRVTRIDYTSPTTGEALWVEITYNNQDRITEILRSNDVRTFYAYDGTGRIVLIQHFGPNNERLDRYDYRYNSVGGLIRVDRVAGQERSSILYTYDVAHRLISERWLNERGEALYTLDVRYDDAGNQAEVSVNGQRTLYVFNNRNQLTGQVSNYTPRDTDTLQLPALPFLLLLLMGGLGLRRHKRLPGMLLALLVVSGLSLGITLAQTPGVVDVRYEYNLNGTLSRIVYGRVGAQNPPILNFSYDEENRLTGVQGRNANNTPVDVALRYDAMSRLVGWQSGSDSRTLSYDGRTPIAMTAANGSTERYLHTDDERLLTITADGSALWHLNDQFNSTRLFTDAAGDLIGVPDRLRDFSSYGTRIFTDDDPDADRTLNQLSFLFNNQPYDPASGLYLLGLRAYDPTSGRFIQPDPLQPELVGNAYTYARNRPLRFFDTSGMTIEPVIEPPTVDRLPQTLQPETLIPQPMLPDIPAAPAVHEVQRDDNFRALPLSDALYRQTNSVVARLSPLLNDFYTLDANPMPQALRDLQAQQIQQTMAHYTPGAGWLPTITPDPFEQQDPFALLSQVVPLVAQATLDPLVFCSGYGHSTPTLSLRPQIALPDAMHARLQGEQVLQQRLVPLQLGAGLSADYAQLSTLTQQNPIPALPAPQVEPMLPAIEPQIADEVDALRQQLARFYTRIYNLGVLPCETCEDYLTIGR